MGQTYMDFIFEGMVQQSRTTTYLISWLGRFTYLCQSKIFWTVQVTSQMVTRRMQFFAESLFDPIYDLDPEKKLVDLHMLDGSSVCRKAQIILKVVYPILSCILGTDHTCHNVFKV